MGILEKLMITNLIKNKKRTITVIIAVALSVFLILSIGMIASSIYNIMLNNIKEQYGEHHILLKEITEEDLSKIESENSILEFGVENNEVNNVVKYDVYIKYKDVNKVCENTNKIIDKLNIYENVRIIGNTELLNLYGIFGVHSKINEFDEIEVVSEYNFISLVDAIVVIVLLILSISCIIIIYNTFSISISERKKQFGILSSLGATKKQIKKAIFFEITIIGIFGIIIGAFLTLLGINIFFGIINNVVNLNIDYKFECVFNLKYILMSLLVIIVTIYLSGIIPAINLRYISPIEEIQPNMINNSKNNNKVKLKKSIFGVEKSIAKKNIKMNKNKYRVIIFSLSLTMILFNSIASFVAYQESLLGVVEEKFGDAQILFSLEKNMDLEKRNEMEKGTNEVKEKILKFNDIEKYYDYRVLSLSVNLHDIDNSYFENAYYEKTIKNEVDMPAERLNIIGLEEKDYIEYIELSGAEYGDNILLNHTYLSDLLNVSNPKKMYVNMFKKVNDLEIDFYDSIGFCDMNGNVSSHSEVVGTLDNLFITNEEIMVFNEYNSSENIVVYTNMDTYNKLFEQTYINCKDKKIDENNWGYSNFNELRILNLDVSNVLTFDKYINNVYKEFDKEFYTQIPELENAEKTLLIKVVKILSYTVIGIIMLIGITTTFNVIYSSLQERKHEFSIMKSVGLEEKGLNKIIFFEVLNLFVKALIITIPISLIINYFIKKSLIDTLVIEGLLIPYKKVLSFVVITFIVLLILIKLNIKLNYKEKTIERLKF